MDDEVIYMEKGWSLAVREISETQRDRKDWSVYIATSPEGVSQVVNTNFILTVSDFSWLIDNNFPVRRFVSPITRPEGAVIPWTRDSFDEAMIESAKEMLSRQPSRSGA